MSNGNHSPRLLIILVIALVIGQVLSINYLKKDFENRITQCYEAVNTNTILQGALVNVLEKKNLLQRNEILQEAKEISMNFMDMVDKTKEMEKQYKEFEKNSDINNGEEKLH